MDVLRNSYTFVSFSRQSDISPLLFSTVIDIRKTIVKGNIKKFVVSQARQHKIKHLYHVLMQYFTVLMPATNLKILRVDRITLSPRTLQYMK
jgi:hypothetical protein